MKKELLKKMNTYFVKYTNIEVETYHEYIPP